MAFLNPTRKGYVVGTGGSSFATSRTANGSLAVDGANGNTGTAIQSFYNSGRGGGTHRQTRTYFHFDTSGISGTVSSVTLRVTGYSQTSSDVIVLNGYNAFGGDGGTTLNVDDFNEVAMGGTSQAYSSQFSAWGTSTNSITLNSNAESRMSSNDDLTIGLINYTHDYSNSAQTTSGAQSAGIAFGTNAVLIYTESSTSAIASVNSITPSNIDQWGATAWSSVASLNGVT
tara:strand:- start:782 stop:1468 length:687 start_codon:yes stop_codon:yes gene_type:complete